MKIIAVMEDDFSRGGGFNQALSAVRQLKRLSVDHFELEVLTTHAGNIEALRGLGIAAEMFKFSLSDRLILHMGQYAWWPSLQARLKMTGAFEKELLSRACDLVYFVTPSGTPGLMQEINYIATVWDVCHRDSPEFPEVRAFGQFQARERHNKVDLAPALLVLTDSDALADSMALRYGLDRSRLLAVPFASASFLEAPHALDGPNVLEKYGLRPDYYFYPAQFWAHKNHIRILEALLILGEQGIAPNVVFAGGDQGNRRHVERFAELHGLSTQVRFLGFVPSEDMRGLYEGCSAVVMPTYFGPTNIPPLEAWEMGKPLIYTSLFREQVGEAALCADPDDAMDLARAIRECGDSEVRARLVRAGRARLQAVQQMRAHAESELLAFLKRFEIRRRCWS